MKKYTIQNRGFTLIELLVVIAIIGILAGIILVAVNGARAKATNVKVISDVKQIRTQLEADYINSTYADLINDGTGLDGGFDPNAPGTTTITQLLGDAEAQGSNITVVISPSSGATPVTAYALYGQSTATSTSYFCMDSTGGTDQDVESDTVPNSITCP